jgi:hypothetical protein
MQTEYSISFNIVFTVHLVYIKNQDQLDAQSLLKTFKTMFYKNIIHD